MSASVPPTKPKKVLIESNKWRSDFTEPPLGSSRGLGIKRLPAIVIQSIDKAIFSVDGKHYEFLKITYPERTVK